VSFYTFQSMSYSIDVYRRRLEPVRVFSTWRFSSPFSRKLVAGPIVRAMTFLRRSLKARVGERGCARLRHAVFHRFLKKACVSDLPRSLPTNFSATREIQPR